MSSSQSAWPSDGVVDARSDAGHGPIIAARLAERVSNDGTNCASSVAARLERVVKRRQLARSRRCRARARRVLETGEVELRCHVPLVVGTAAHRRALALAEGDDLERRALLLVLVDVVLRRELPLEVGLCVVVVAEAREDVVVDARDVLARRRMTSRRAVLLEVVSTRSTGPRALEPVDVGMRGVKAGGRGTGPRRSPAAARPAAPAACKSTWPPCSRRLRPRDSAPSSTPRPPTRRARESELNRPDAVKVVQDRRARQVELRRRHLEALRLLVEDVRPQPKRRQPAEGAGLPLLVVVA